MTGSKKQMQVTAEWLGKRRFQAKGPSGYPVVMDSSEQFGGEGSGNSPLELVLVGLVGCIGIGVTKLLEKMRQSLESLDIVADGIREESLPHAIIEIHLTFNVKGAIAPTRIWQAVKLESEQYCPVAASLKAIIVPHVVLNGIDTPAPALEGQEEQQ
ncbi:MULTISPECIES: OsmC family protein [unclassified Paenibacillus]|uniref:OsmC family protein n=1 Tax=unclassified Paenibacillus TaxID=185978 RepID=UPI00363C53A7